MKRKAMLMGMAVMTGLPGWVLAKGSGKMGEDLHHAPSSRAVQETNQRGEAEEYLSPADQGGRSESPPGKAAELLAHMKEMLRGANYGVAPKPAASQLGWSMELLESGRFAAYDSYDSRMQKNRPMGLAFRIKF